MGNGIGQRRGKKLTVLKLGHRFPVELGGHIARIIHGARGIEHDPHHVQGPVGGLGRAPLRRDDSRRDRTQAGDRPKRVRELQTRSAWALPMAIP